MLTTTDAKQRRVGQWPGGLRSLREQLKILHSIWKITSNSPAHKYYSSASHHEQKNQKTTGKIKFSAVTIK